MIEFEILRIIWWVLLGVLLAGFAIFGGMDLGVAALLPFVGKNESEKRIVINSIAPTWESNQVWFILGGGAIFAAWPLVYSIAFSNFYYALLLVLLVLILRPVGFDFRNKIDNKLWRWVWTIALFIGGVVAPMVFGVAVGNVMQGIDFDLDNFMYIKNSTDFWSLFTPFTLLCGLLSLSMMITQGACYLVIKTTDSVCNRAKLALKIFPLITIILFSIGGFMASNMEGFAIIEGANPSSHSNPHEKVVMLTRGGWLENYYKMPWIMIAPILGFVAVTIVWLLVMLGKYSYLIALNSLSIFGIVTTVGLSMFPFIIPSKLHYTVSLTVWDASSSQLSLFIMLLAALVFMPIVLFYISWVYKVLFGKVTKEYIKQNNHELY